MERNLAANVMTELRCKASGLLPHDAHLCCPLKAHHFKSKDRCDMLQRGDKAIHVSEAK